jgi:hypothetical protein
MSTILLIVLVLLLLGALPTWPYSRSWGYYPSGGLGLVVVWLSFPLCYLCCFWPGGCEVWRASGPIFDVGALASSVDRGERPSPFLVRGPGNDVADFYCELNFHKERHCRTVKVPLGANSFLTVASVAGHCRN